MREKLAKKKKRTAQESFKGRHALLGRKAKYSPVLSYFFCPLVDEWKTRKKEKACRDVNEGKESEKEEAIYLLFRGIMLE